MSGLYVAPQLVFGGRCAFAYVDEVAVAVLNVPRWTPESAVAYVEEITELGQGVASAATLTDFRGAMLGAQERRAIVSWLDARGLGAQARACLLADSVLLRGAVTAYSWMTGTDGRAFARDEYSKACAWTVSPTRVPAIDVERALLSCSRLLGYSLGGARRSESA